MGPRKDISGSLPAPHGTHLGFPRGVADPPRSPKFRIQKGGTKKCQMRPKYVSQKRVVQILGMGPILGSWLYAPIPPPIVPLPSPKTRLRGPSNSQDRTIWCFTPYLNSYDRIVWSLTSGAGPAFNAPWAFRPATFVPEVGTSAANAELAVPEAGNWVFHVELFPAS